MLLYDILRFPSLLCWFSFFLCFKECNCNNHAERCNFSKEVYQESGHISGSVCIDCQHNTAGNTCEQCKPLFYHDPGRDISDPYTCLR